ncbi:Zinc finger BED domain-containing protein DAYSLEEPER, partial [Zea mays]
PSVRPPTTRDVATLTRPAVRRPPSRPSCCSPTAVQVVLLFADRRRGRPAIANTAVQASRRRSPAVEAVPSVQPSRRRRHGRRSRRSSRPGVVLQPPGSICRLPSRVPKTRPVPQPQTRRRRSTPFRLNACGVRDWEQQPRFGKHIATASTAAATTTTSFCERQQQQLCFSRKQEKNKWKLYGCTNCSVVIFSTSS